MIAVIFGIAFAVLGIWGIVIWWADFISVMRGMMPFMFFVGGVLAMLTGVMGIIDGIEQKKKIRSDMKRDISGEKKEPES